MLSELAREQDAFLRLWTAGGSRKIPGMGDMNRFFCPSDGATPLLATPEARVRQWPKGPLAATWAALALLLAFSVGCSDDSGLLKRADKAAARFHTQLAEGQIEAILESVAPALRREAGDDALRAEFTRLSVLGPVVKYRRVAGNAVQRDGLFFVALSLKNEYRADSTVEELSFVFKGKKTWLARVSVQVIPKATAAPAAPASGASAASAAASDAAAP